MRTTLPAIVMLCGWATLAAAQADAPETVVQALMSDDAATRQAAEADAVRLGAPMVKPLCDLMAKGDTRSVTVAEKALFAIAAAASGNEEARAHLAWALAQQAYGASSDRAQAYALRLLGLLGDLQTGHRIAGRLVKAPTFDEARAALERIDDPALNEVLEHMISHVPVERQPDVIRSLGAHRQRSAVPFLLTLARARERPDWRPAALDALGMIADPSAAVVLAEAADDPDEAIRSAAIAALIALADAEQQRGGPLARRCYRKALDHAVTRGQHAAALIGLSQTDPSMRMQWLLKGMGEGHTRRLAQAELLKTEAAQLAGPLYQRMSEAQGEELEALRGLAGAKGIAVSE